MNYEYCAALSRRFNANRECYRIRLLSGTPPRAYLAAYQKVKRKDGEPALAQLKAKLRAEVQRQRAVPLIPRAGQARY